MLSVVMFIGLTTSVLALEDKDTYTKDTYSTSSIQTVKLINSENLNQVSHENLNELSLDNENLSFKKEPEGIESFKGVSSYMQTRSTWLLNDPIAIVDGNLSETSDFYVVQNTSNVYAFLKLTAEDPNLLAVLYYVNSDGTLGSSTGFGVFANQDYNAIGLPVGVYAIVIGSFDGSARGSYTLHWNRSNPYAEMGESAIPISVTEDLAKVALYYKDDKILNNGTNVMSDLTYEETREFTIPHGHAYVKTKIYQVYETGNIYTGFFSYQDSTPYSTDNALIIELERAGYTYVDRFYQNINGDVTSWMRFEDPVTGLTTPRILGDGLDDAYYAPHYLIIDLNTNQVVDFVSVFNYFYLIHGREASMSNLSLVN